MSMNTLSPINSFQWSEDTASLVFRQVSSGWLAR
jgi:hypothetical protein